MVSLAAFSILLQPEAFWINEKFCNGLQPPPNMPQAPANQPQPAAQELTQTATIRNAVNLKKNTIKLVPVADSLHKFSIHFIFDASTSCR